MKKLWRLFELRDGNLLTLFHGIGGSRTVPIGEWIKAKQGIVSDNGKNYRSGFHALSGYADVKNFMWRFYASRTIVAVKIDVRGRIRKKPTNRNVFLVAQMRIPTNHKRYILKTASNGN